MSWGLFEYIFHSLLPLQKCIAGLFLSLLNDIFHFHFSSLLFLALNTPITWFTLD